jgi:hypothetical protein
MKYIGTLIFGFVAVVAGLLLLVDFRRATTILYEWHQRFWGRRLYPEWVLKIVASALLLLGLGFLVGSVVGLVRN